MKKYVVCNEQAFDVLENNGRFVIKDGDIDEITLKEIFLENKSEYFTNMLSSFKGLNIPFSWIKKEYIRDHEFVAKHYPEFLI